MGSCTLQECTGVEVFLERVSLGASAGSVAPTAVVWGGGQPRLGRPESGAGQPGVHPTPSISHPALPLLPLLA